MINNIQFVSLLPIKVISELSECGNITKNRFSGATSMSCQMIIEAVNQPPS